MTPPVPARHPTHGSPGLEIREIESVERFSEIRADWESLQGAHGVAAPDAAPDLFAATLTALGRPASPRVVMFRQGAEPRALLVGRVSRKGVGCRLGYARIQTPRLRCLEVPHGGLVTDGSAAARQAVQTYLEHLLARRVVDLVVLQHLPHSHELFEPLSRRAVAGNVETHWRLDLEPGSHDATLRRFGKKHRYNLRRTDRIFTDHFGGEVFLRRFGRREGLDEFIRGACRIASQSYQARLGVGFADDLRWRTILDNLAHHDRLCAYWLEAKGSPIAFQIGALWRETYFLLATSYLPAFAPLSPGTVLLVRILRDLCERGVRVVDYGFGHAEYKQNFGSRSWTEQTLRLYGPGVRSRLVRTMDLVLEGLSSGVSAMVHRLDLPRRIKRRWRRSAR